MEEVILSESEISRIESGETISTAEGSVARYKSDVDKPNVDYLFPDESIVELKNGGRVEFEAVIFRPELLEATDSANDDNTTEDENARQKDLTRIEVDTSMLHQLATGNVSIEIELDEEEWQELAKGGSVETEDILLDYRK